ncbi:MAG: CHASE domain-containing protein [Acidimicrobiia bacterium]|nr:CHASE domain-containing protein [Acidimicrobiia bacterium]
MPRRLVHPDTSARWRILAGAVVFGIGMTVTLLASRWIGQANHREEMQRLEENGRTLVASLQNALQRVESRVAAVAGFLRVLDDVTQEELEEFVDELGLLGGVAGFGYAPLIDAADLEPYLARIRTRTPGYEVFGVDAEGNRVPVATQAEYLPLEVFAPPEAFGTPPRGLDFLSERIRRAAVREARRTRAIAVTPLIQMLGEDSADGAVVFGPVLDDDGAMLGVVVAGVDVSLLLESQVPAHVLDTLAWEISDPSEPEAVTSFDHDQVVWEDFVTVGNRVWRVTATAIPAHAGVAGLTDLSVPTGVAGSLMSALLVVLWLQHLHVKTERARSKADSMAKDRFLASVSHELRTPLTAVVGFLEEAQRPGYGTSAPVREMLSIAHDQAVEIEHIVEDLLVVARIDDSLPAAESKPVELAAEVAQVAAGFPPEIQAGIRHEGVGTAIADAVRTRQIIRNLIANAAIHGAPPIEIAVLADRKWVRLQVRDHGDGVARQHRDRLFEPYASFRQSAAGPQSLGIGLWLSRRLARLMGGDLRYRHDGDGPVFELTLPLADARPSITPPPSGEPAGHDRPVPTRGSAMAAGAEAGA